MLSVQHVITGYYLSFKCQIKLFHFSRVCSTSQCTFKICASFLALVKKSFIIAMINDYKKLQEVTGILSLIKNAHDQYLHNLIHFLRKKRRIYS